MVGDRARGDRRQVADGQRRHAPSPVHGRPGRRRSIPSTSTVPCTRPVGGQRGDVVGRVAACGRRATARRCRTRAGSAPAPATSGSGSGPSGTSNSSRPCSSRNVRSVGRMPLEDLAEAGQPRPRRQVGGQGRTERRAGSARTTSSIDGAASSGRPSHDSAVVTVTWPALAPHAARRHLDERRAGCGRRRRCAGASRSGKRGAERSAQLRPSSAAARRAIAGRPSPGRRRGRRRAGAGAKSRWRRELAVEHRLDERPQRRQSSARDEVDRSPASRRCARRGARRASRLELVGVERRRAATTARGTGRAGPGPAGRRGGSIASSGVEVVAARAAAGGPASPG